MTIPSFSSIRNAVADWLMTDTIKASLTNTRADLAAATTKCANLEREVKDLEARLKQEKLEHQQTRQVLEQLQELHKEEVRLVNGTEFRKGLNTGGQWIPFCPLCRVTAVVVERGIRVVPRCTDGRCQWKSAFDIFEIPEVLAELR